MLFYIFFAIVNCQTHRLLLQDGEFFWYARHEHYLTGGSPE